METAPDDPLSDTASDDPRLFIQRLITGHELSPDEKIMRREINSYALNSREPGFNGPREVLERIVASHYKPAASPAKPYSALLLNAQRKRVMVPGKRLGEMWAAQQRYQHLPTRDQLISDFKVQPGFGILLFYAGTVPEALSDENVVHLQEHQIGGGGPALDFLIWDQEHSEQPTLYSTRAMQFASVSGTSEVTRDVKAVMARIINPSDHI